MDIQIFVFFAIFVVLLLSIIRNLLSYIFLKDKIYFSFMLFLICFLSIFTTKKIYPLSNFYDENIGYLISIFNIVFVSGATVYFSENFLKIKTINKITKYYFLFELFLLIPVVILYINKFSVLTLSSFVHFVVFIYAVILMILILINMRNKFFILDIRDKVKTVIFLLMHSSMILITFLNIKIKTVPVYLYSFILSMIFYIEIDLLLKASLSIRVPKNIEAVKLSKIDKEIIKYILQGLLYKEISYKLNISESTVKKKISKLFRLFGVKTKAELISLIYKNQNVIN